MSNHKHKAFKVTQFKAADDVDSGEFEALVSVFGNVDMMSDRVMPGAFRKSLARWESSGDPIPVIWSHDWKDPHSHIGKVTEATETADGLRVKGQIDLDAAKARQVFKLLKGRRVTQFSFAYDVLDSKFDEEQGVNDLLELNILEVGPTLIGANPDTQLYAVKHGVLDADGVADLHPDDESLLAKSEPDDDGDTPPEPDPAPVEDPDPGDDSDAASKQSLTDADLAAIRDLIRSEVKALADTATGATPPPAGNDNNDDDSSATDDTAADNANDEEPTPAKSEERPADRSVAQLLADLRGMDLVS